MIVDIEGKEINVGDECYMPAKSMLVRIKVTGETSKTIKYKWKSIKTNDWHTWDTYMYKSSNAALHLLKI